MQPGAAAILSANTAALDGVLEEQPLVHDRKSQ